MASLVVLEGGAMMPHVCENDDSCDQCPLVGGCWFIEEAE